MEKQGLGGSDTLCDTQVEGGGFLGRVEIRSLNLGPHFTHVEYQLERVYFIHLCCYKYEGALRVVTECITVPP